jgi:hypothetical protein
MCRVFSELSSRRAFVAPSYSAYHSASAKQFPTSVLQRRYRAFELVMTERNILPAV